MDVATLLEIDEDRNVVSRCKARNDFVLMFVDPAYQVVCNACVKGTRSVRHDVYEIAVARHIVTQRKSRPFAMAQGDTGERLSLVTTLNQ